MIQLMLGVAALGVIASGQYYRPGPKTTEYHPSLFLNPAPPVSPAASFIHYDSSGLGFEIGYSRNPGTFQYQYRPQKVFLEKHPVSTQSIPEYISIQSVPEYIPYHPQIVEKPEKQEKTEKYDRYCPRVIGLESQCRPIKDCALWFDNVITTQGTACQLPGGEPGCCCPAIPYNGKHCINSLIPVIMINR